MVVLKEQKYHLYRSKDEYSEVLQSLIRLKNSLIAQGRYTDAADDILCKVLSAKKRKFKIKYVHIGGNALGVDGFGDRYESALNVPAKDDLSDRLIVV